MRRSVIALLMLLALVAPANAADDQIVPAPSVRETTPVESTGDAMDDPAVWVHPTDPSRSLVIGNNKQGALETYDLEGNRVRAAVRRRHLLGQRRRTPRCARRRRRR